ncbi:hypothetical protein JSU10_07620 [Escherichia coli H20]|nr:hypothetical protein JSU10_07620 [Escherichia coli H20]
MSKFVKTAIAAAMVMGVFTSTATIAAGNNGLVDQIQSRILAPQPAGRA